MPLNAAQQAALSAALDRLQNYYDGDNPYNPATNPGGFRQGGQVVNFEPALKDTATVMNLASVLVADATAAATNSPKAVRVDSALPFSDTERAQGRANVTSAPGNVSATGSFSTADLGRKIRASGTITRTLPAISSVFAGWSTDVFENAGTGIVTIAANSGDAFEGVASGSLGLLPKQRAYFYLDADGWHVGWVDRCPIVSAFNIATPVASVDLRLPVGYRNFNYSISGLTVDTTGANVLARLSSDNGSNYKSGTSDYSTIQNYSGTNLANGGQSLTYYGFVSAIELASTLKSENVMPAIITGSIFPGDGVLSRWPSDQHRTSQTDSSGVISDRSYTANCPGLAGLIANAIRISASSGNLNGGAIAIRGIA